MSADRSSPPLSALLQARGVLAERVLVDVVAGEHVSGSWWGHPSGQAIFRALQQLREDPDIFLCKLFDGKQTYVHRRLWPALLRVQSEPSLWPALSAAARRLLRQVQAEGAVQATGRLRLELERSLRVVARSEHTPSGAHQVVLTPFEAHFSEADVAAASRLRLAEAQAALAPPGPTPAPRPTSRKTAKGRPGRASTVGQPGGQVTPLRGAAQSPASPRASRPAPPPSRRRPPKR